MLGERFIVVLACTGCIAFGCAAAEPGPGANNQPTAGQNGNDGTQNINLPPAATDPLPHSPTSPPAQTSGTNHPPSPTPSDPYAGTYTGTFAVEKPVQLMGNLSVTLMPPSGAGMATGSLKITGAGLPAAGIGGTFTGNMTGNQVSASGTFYGFPGSVMGELTPGDAGEEKLSGTFSIGPFSGIFNALRSN
jgi:hypothetical protein